MAMRLSTAVVSIVSGGLWLAGCGEGPGPANRVPPSVLGTQATGELLTATEGEWEGSPDGLTLEYAWHRCTAQATSLAGTQGCTVIDGENEATYRLACTDLGHHVLVVVTATDSQGSTQAVSAKVGPIESGPPVFVTPPVILEAPELWRPVQYHQGTWAACESVGTHSTVWSCDAAGEGCEEMWHSYPTVQDIGRRLRVRTTVWPEGTNAWIMAFSEASADVVVEAPPLSVTPAFPCTYRAGQGCQAPIEGSVVGLTGGEWRGGSALFLAYQWLRCDQAGETCAELEGAIAAEYAAVAEDVGKTLRARVTAADEYGVSTRTTHPSEIAVAKAPVNTEGPTISGIASSGAAQTANVGSWTGTGTISFGYRWDRCSASCDACNALAGQNQKTYTATAGDVGFTLRVTVTGYIGQEHSQATSACTAVVAP